MLPDVVVLLLAASATALATGIGAIPVFLFGTRTQRLTPFLLGLLHLDHGRKQLANLGGQLGIAVEILLQ